jgi:hypothetical protein
MQVEQGIIGRIFGFGSITVSGTGGVKNPFHKIADPLEFRKVAQEQIAIVLLADCLLGRKARFR